MNELQLKYNSQAVEYDELMAEKAEEERKIFEEKAYQFLLNRSARRIQRYWRAFRERKLARKRARKSKQKGGKKKQKSPPPPKKDGKYFITLLLFKPKYCIFRLRIRQGTRS